MISKHVEEEEIELKDILLDYCGVDCTVTHTVSEHKIIQSVVKERLEKLISKTRSTAEQRGRGEVTRELYLIGYEDGERRKRPKKYKEIYEIRNNKTIAREKIRTNIE